jgi:hypothetical protein
VEGKAHAVDGARVVRVREELLPAALVVPHELVVAASRQWLGPGRLEAPRALEECVDPRFEVDELVDVGAFCR